MVGSFTCKSCNGRSPVENKYSLIVNSEGDATRLQNVAGLKTAEFDDSEYDNLLESIMEEVDDSERQIHLQICAECKELCEKLISNTDVEIKISIVNEKGRNVLNT